MKNEVIFLALGCFWGAERKFQQQKGVLDTDVGYMGGTTLDPTYNQICTGTTGHAEVVKVMFDSLQISLDRILQIFWESHNPTQGMRQGNDVGTQYRSGIYYTTTAQKDRALITKNLYQEKLTKAGFGIITTEILPAPDFYFAEDYHQDYLTKNPNGYCGLGGTGISCTL